MNPMFCDGCDELVENYTQDDGMTLCEDCK